MKTKFTTITMFVLFISVIAANAEQTKSEIGKSYFLDAKKALLSNPKNTDKFKHLSFTENQLSVPGFSEDYTWNEELNDWQHVSNSTHTYNNSGRLVDEVLHEPETGMIISRIGYAYDLSGNNTITEEFAYDADINRYHIINGEWIDYSRNSQGQIIGYIEKVVENGEWLNKTKIEYILDQNNIPILWRTYHWVGYNWILHSRTGLLTWADWPNRELAAYTMQYWQDGNWVNAERYSKQNDGDSYTSTTEIWENEQWVNSARETYSLTINEEELIMENWTAQGWQNTEKYQGTFDEYGNPTGMKYSSWYDTGWEIEMVLFLDLTYTGSNDVVEMVVRHWDPSLVEPVNLSKYIYSNFLHFTTDVPEVSVLNNVKVFPNPVSSTFTIQIDENANANYQVNIVNLAGQTVFSNSYSNPSISVNTENFTTGMYLLNIKTDDGKIHNSKLLKQ
ncbi:MAG: T9SS type A sorting domain-containing protein [Draconibacterium sp.]|nr:T9SS type A sorting domain-containing protein [Draconibacterium sp.]